MSRLCGERLSTATRFLSRISENRINLSKILALNSSYLILPDDLNFTKDWEVGWSNSFRLRRAMTRRWSGASWPFFFYISWLVSLKRRSSLVWLTGGLVDRRTSRLQRLNADVSDVVGFHPFEPFFLEFADFNFGFDFGVQR